METSDSPPSKPLVKLENVSKSYFLGKQEVPALRSISLEIASGEFLAVMGPSGSGKSTLMNIIGLLDTPSAGKVYLDGKPTDILSENSTASIRGEMIGFVFQTFNLIPRLTAVQNVMLPMTFVKKVAKSDRRSRAENLLSELGLRERLDHRPNELSGGERQRVSIGRALANDPTVILADEPTGNLDSETGHTIMEILRGLNKEGRTVIVVTHNFDVAGFAQRRISLKDGWVIGG